MPDHYLARRDKLLHQVRQEELAGLVVSNPINVSYLTGFSGDSSYVLLFGEQALLVSDGRFTTQIQEECPGLAYHIRPPAQTTQQAAAEILAKLGSGAVAVDAGHLTVADFQTLADRAKSIAWKAESGRVEEMRQIKDDCELQQIRAAIAMAEKAFAMFRAMLRGKDTEKELADNMEMYIRRAGGTCSSFPTIVAAGPRAALPHAHPVDRPVGEDELLLVDWGASETFYKSDLTRVLWGRKKATSLAANGANGTGRDLRQLYELVLRAQRQAIAQVRPGVKTGAVDAAARNTLADDGYAEYFTHSTGHGLGMAVHEGPFLRPNSELVLQPGMVITIEPGIYLPGWGGIRIEDDVLVTPDGCELLTSVPRDFDAQWLDF
jgi:Xaa-Pro aminopeptidase